MNKRTRNKYEKSHNSEWIRKDDGKRNTMKWQLPICSACCMKRSWSYKICDSKTKEHISGNSIVWKWKSIEMKENTSKDELMHQKTKTYTLHRLIMGWLARQISNTIFGMLKLLEQNHWKIKWIYYYHSRIKTDGIVNGNRAPYNSTTFQNPKYDAHTHIAHCTLHTAYSNVVHTRSHYANVTKHSPYTTDYRLLSACCAHKHSTIWSDVVGGEFNWKYRTNGMCLIFA